MPKYLLQGSYTQSGAAGLLKDGGSKRLAVVKALVTQGGGTLEAFYFAFGENDFYVITDLPSHSAAVAISIAVNASGAVKARTVPLLTAQEIDAATQQGGGVQYQAPGT